MIVPSMSYEEMRAEFMHDLHIAEVRARNTYKILLFNMRKRHQQHATETITWKSPLHNTWMSIYSMNGEFTNCVNVCITMDHGNLLKTLSGIGNKPKEEIFIGEYNIHFYKRYNERMKLNLPNPMRIVKHYFKNNMRPGNVGELYRTKDQDSQKIFLPVTGGVLLGYQYTSKKWVEAKTFISDEMLRESQMEKVEYLKNYKLDRGTNEQRPPAL